MFLIRSSKSFCKIAPSLLRNACNCLRAKTNCSSIWANSRSSTSSTGVVSESGMRTAILRNSTSGPLGEMARICSIQPRTMGALSVEVLEAEVFSTVRVKSIFPRSRVSEISFLRVNSFSLQACAIRVLRSMALLLRDFISIMIFLSASCNRLLPKPVMDCIMVVCFDECKGTKNIA